MTTLKTSQLENWLNVLITSYQYQPDHASIKYILYYIERITNENDDELNVNLCDYLHMKRFWQWKLQQPIC